MFKQCQSRGACALVVGVTFSLGLLLNSGAALAAIESRTILKSYFQTGSIPTGDDFKDLIDSYIHLEDDGVTFVTLNGIGRTGGSGPNGQGLRVSANVGINELLPYATLHAGYTAADLPEMEPQWAGNFGFLPLRFSNNATGQTHFGYLQGRMELSGTATVGPAFQAQYVVWESTPETPIVTAVVPEPVTGAIAAASLTIFAGMRGRARRREDR